MIFENLSEEQKQQVLELEKSKTENAQVTIDRNINLNNGKFSVVEYLKYKSGNSYRYYYIIVCNDCGNIKKVNKTGFENVNTCQNCNTIKHQQEFVGFENIAYVVLKFDHVSNRKLYYLCKCKNCGSEIVIRKDSILEASQCHCVNCKGNNKQPSAESPINVYEYYYKQGAKERGFLWELSHDQFKQIISKPCHYCGSLPHPIQSLARYTKVKDEINVNGIDRIDSSKNYTQENCVPCCTMCNRMKLNYSLSEFVEHVNKIHNHMCSTTIPEGSTSQANGDGNGEIPLI